MRTLIMMARAKMLELESRPPDQIARNEDETDADFEIRNEEHWSQYFLQATVRLSEMGHRNQQVFDARIGAERSRSSAAASSGGQLLDKLLSSRTEISDLLHDLYTSHVPRRTVIVSRACGGCPVDRRHHHVNLHYTLPNSFGIEQVEPPDLTVFRERFPHLSTAAPIIVALPDNLPSSKLVDILADLVSTFNIREIAIPDSIRDLVGISSLHRRAEDRILLIQSLEEEALSRPTVYQLARASVLGDHHSAESLLLLVRPLHLILASPDARDPFHSGRRLIETGNNILSLDHLRAEVRR
jgi:hypothetical protein